MKYTVCDILLKFPEQTKTTVYFKREAELSDLIL